MHFVSGSIIRSRASRSQAQATRCCGPEGCHGVGVAWRGREARSPRECCYRRGPESLRKVVQCLQLWLHQVGSLLATRRTRASIQCDRAAGWCAMSSYMDRGAPARPRNICRPSLVPTPWDDSLDSLKTPLRRTRRPQRLLPSRGIVPLSSSSSSTPPSPHARKDTCNLYLVLPRSRLFVALSCNLLLAPSSRQHIPAHASLSLATFFLFPFSCFSLSHSSSSYLPISIVVSHSSRR